MAITVKSSLISDSANNIVAIGTRSTGSSVLLIKQYNDFGRFLNTKIFELNRTTIPKTNEIKELSKINVANTFGSAGGLISSLASGALDAGGLVSDFFSGKDNKLGQKSKSPSVKPKPKAMGGRLRMGGVRALGVANALFAGLDFATGLAEGESVGKAGAGAAGSLAGSLLGGAIGQALIPIPGLGFVIGSAAGSFLGGWAADRVYDAGANALSSVSQKQEEKLKKEKEKAPNIENQFSAERQNKVIKKFDSSVSVFEGFIRDLSTGKLTLGSQAPMDQVSQTSASATAPPGPGEQGETYTAEGGRLPSSSTITSGYGWRWGREHWGTDYGEPVGTPVSVIVPGKVIERTDNDPGAGGSIWIKHDDGTETRYLHLSKIFVKNGDTITPGTVIGETGGEKGAYGSGRSTGPHLHFEYYASHLNPKDPAPYADKYFRFGGNVRVTSRPGTATPGASAMPTTGLVPGSTVSTAYGRQSSMPTANIPATKKDNIRGYLVVPGHIAGGGTAGEQAAVQKIAMHVVNTLKSMYPTAEVRLWNNRSYGDSTPEFSRQMEDLKKMEQQGWQIVELHLDAPGGTGRGVILPYDRGNVNPLESYIAGTQGVYPQNWGEGGPGGDKLGGPKRGIGLVELGNMTDELRVALARNDQRAIEFISRDIIAAFRYLASTGQLPGVSASQSRTQAMVLPQPIQTVAQVAPRPAVAPQPQPRPAPSASYTPTPSSARNLNINYQTPYNNAATRVVYIDRPTVAMVPMPGTSGRANIIPVASPRGGTVNVAVSNPDTTLSTLNKIQEYRLV